MSEAVNSPVIFLILIPLLGAAAALFEKGLPKLKISRAAALLSIFSGIVLVVWTGPELRDGVEMGYSLGGWAEPFGIALYLDGLAWLGSLVVYGVAFPILLFAVGERIYSASFYFYFLVMVAAMEGVILTGDIFNMFVFFEILALCSYILIAYLKKPRALVASFKYLLISTLGISFFLIGIFILYRLTGSLSLREIGIHLEAAGGSGPPGELLQTGIALVCLLVGIGVRTAFIPFHPWLPEAHAYAPHPVSAMLSGVMIKVSFIVLWRITTLFAAPFTGELLIVTGAVTAAGGVLWALMQRDAKKLLAFHSVSQMGYIVAAFGAGTAVSLTASFYHLFNHALFKSLLFLSIGTVIACTGERDVKKLRGLALKLPFVAVPFTAAALSIAGIPPFNGYVSKQLISYSLKSHWVYPLIWFTGAGTVASFLKLSAIFRGGKRTGHVLVPVVRKPLRLLYPSLWMLAGACLITGIFPSVMSSGIFCFLQKGSRTTDMLLFPGVYSREVLLSSVIPVLTGCLLYLGVQSKRGQKAAESLSRMVIGTDGALFLILGGFLLFAFYAMTRIIW